MALYAVSDLHIRGPDDPLHGFLISLVRDRALAGDTLVLAGDIFDLFVGDKPLFRERYAELLSELSRAGARGVRIHYIEGNHDFHLARAFAGVPGMEVHPSEMSCELGGKRFYVAHGDLADRHDYGYRALRLAFRSPVMRAFVALAPDHWIDALGRESSRYSREQRVLLPAELPPEKLERLRRAYRNFALERIRRGFDFVIMGHCHDLDEMSFTVEGHQGQYVNMGYPRAHRSFVAWEPGDTRLRRERLFSGI